MVQLGDVRIKIVADDDFDFRMEDWDASLRKTTRAKISNGTWDVYEVMIQRAEPGEWDIIDSLFGCVYASGLHGTYTSVTDITDPQMRDCVTEMLANNEL